LRSLRVVRWLVEHGFDPSSPGCEFDVLRSRMCDCTSTISYGCRSHRAGDLLKCVAFRTDEVMVLEDPGQPAEGATSPSSPRETTLAEALRGHLCGSIMKH